MAPVRNHIRVYYVAVLLLKLRFRRDLSIIEKCTAAFPILVSSEMAAGPAVYFRKRPALYASVAEVMEEAELALIPIWLR